MNILQSAKTKNEFIRRLTQIEYKNKTNSQHKMSYVTNYISINDQMVTFFFSHLLCLHSNVLILCLLSHQCFHLFDKVCKTILLIIYCIWFVNLSVFCYNTSKNTCMFYCYLTSETISSSLSLYFQMLKKTKIKI